MLSILIPTYNYNSALLVNDLYEQATRANIVFEIILADDASTQYKEENRAINLLPHCQLIELKQNIGRSAIRNFLSDKAQYSHLLFLDCDAAVCNDDFIVRYVVFCNETTAVVGGTAYDTKEKNPNYSLRLKYGREREANRIYNPNFTTFNFLIPKAFFQKVRFNEKIKGYGHEDTLFGAMLQKQTQIQLIDNPLIHCGLDENKLFIRKTEIAVENLLQLYKTGNISEIYDHSKLLQTYCKLEKKGIIKVLGMLFRGIKPLLVWQICSKHPQLFLFDCYKIGYMCTL